MARTVTTRRRIAIRNFGSADDQSREMGPHRLVENTRLSRSVKLVLLAIVILIVGSLFALNAGRLLIVEDLRKADTILVLSGDTQYRPQRALELLRQGYARRVLLNASADARFYNVTEADLARNFVASLSPDIRDAVAVCPIHELSTAGEAREANQCLEAAGARTVLIVTSDYHTRRALDTFRHRVPQRQFSITASGNPVEFGTRWWRHRQWAKRVIDEWERLLWWEAVDRWQKPQHHN